jgi:hypothetical protein
MMTSLGVRWFTKPSYRWSHERQTREGEVSRA